MRRYLFYGMIIWSVICLIGLAYSTVALWHADVGCLDILLGSAGWVVIWLLVFTGLLMLSRLTAGGQREKPSDHVNQR